MMIGIVMKETQCVMLCLKFKKQEEEEGSYLRDREVIEMKVKRGKKGRGGDRILWEKIIV